MPSDPHLPELQVLQRKSAAARDENEWLIFDIRDAEVRARDGSLASLLDANPDFPVTVTGELCAKRAEANVKESILPGYKSKLGVPIAVTRCTYFAYGAYDNGDIAIWAAGEAGWHQIRPAESYVAIFQKMTEAVRVLYFLIDCYTDGTKAPAAEVFKRYANVNKITPKAAVERFYEHSKFLASRMAKSEEGISWDHTSFYQHLRKVKPEAFSVKPKSAPLPTPAATAAGAGRAVPARTQPREARETRSGTRSVPPSPPRRATEAAHAVAPQAVPAAPRPRGRPRKDAQQAQVTSDQPRRPPGRPRRDAQESQPQSAVLETVPRGRGRPRQDGHPTVVQQAPAAPLLSEMNKTRAREVWKFMQQKTNDVLPEVGEMTIETFSSFLYQAYNFPDEKEAQYLLKYLAPELVGMMAIPRGRSYDPWTELPIYDELMEAKAPPRVKGRIAAMKLVKRDAPLPEDSESEGSEAESSSEESTMTETEAKKRKRETARRRISALRPKSASKYTGNGAKRKGKGKATGLPEDEEMIDIEPPVEDLRATDTPSKRKSMSDDDEEQEEESPQYPNKRFTRSHGDIDPELEDLEFELQQARSTGTLPIRRKTSQATIPGPTINGILETTLGLISEPAPDMQPNAPGDIWKCPHAGCVHKVYGASEYENKELVRDHLLDHKEKKRVDLIRGEESATHLPVNHLLKRIREMAERAGGESIRPLGDGLIGLFPAKLERVM